MAIFRYKTVMGSISYIGLIDVEGELKEGPSLTADPCEASELSVAPQCWAICGTCGGG
jgi:hypothetical protein